MKVLAKHTLRIIALVLTLHSRGRKLRVWRDYGTGKTLVFHGVVTRVVFQSRFGDSGPTLVAVAEGTLPGQQIDPFVIQGYRIALDQIKWNRQTRQYESLA